MAAGVTTIAATTARATTAIAAYAKDFRKGIGKNTSADIERATVIAEKSTLRPALAMVRTSAASRSAPLPSSSRNRLMISNV